MAKLKLTDKQKKKVIADYIKCQNYSEVARKHGLSWSGVKKIVVNNQDSVKQFEQKQEENTQDTLMYMSEQHETKKRILDKILIAIEQKAENVDMFTNIKDLATAYGIIIDKELKYAEIKAAKESHDETTINRVMDLLAEVKKKADDGDGI